MISLAVDLPSPTPDQLGRVLVDELSRTAGEKAMLETRQFVENQGRFDFHTHEFMEFAAARLRTMRSLRAWMQTVDSLFTQLGGACHALDVLRIELLRHTYPRVYERVVDASSYLVEHRWGPLDSMRAATAALGDNRDSRRKAARELVAELVRDAGDMEIESLLGAVFPVVEYSNPSRGNTSYDGNSELYEREKRLAHPKFWDRYLGGQIVRGEIPDSDLTAILAGLETLSESQSNAAAITEVFKGIVGASKAHPEEKRLSQVLEFLHLHRQKLREQPRLCAALMRALGNVAADFSIEGRGFMRQSERDKAQLLMVSLLPGVDEGERGRVLSDLAEMSTSMDAVMYLAAIDDEGWRSVGIAEGALGGLEIGKVRDVAASRVQRILDGSDFSILRNMSNLPLIVFYQWLGLLPQEKRAAGRAAISDFILRGLESSADVILGFRDCLLETPSGLGQKDMDNVVDIQRIVKVIGAEEYQQGVKSKFGGDAHTAIHQCANWLSTPPPKRGGL